MFMKTIIIDIAPSSTSGEELEYRMSELESLVSTYGGATIVKRVQKRDTPDYRTFIWSGKLDELIILWSELGAELLIVGNILKPAQIWNINEHLRKQKSKMKAWDRVDLILKIFSLHAESPESRLQIELAAIKHMGPRIFGMGMELSRQWGGSKNAKGQGETNTEIMKRHLREKELFLQKKLETYQKTRALHRASRKRKWFPTVGIVGYTNAGKSTLMNVLTKKWVLAEDKLFVTLGTHVGKMWIEDSPWENDSIIWDVTKYWSSDVIPQESSKTLYTELKKQVASWKEVLINDTIGFIRDLPPDLIVAFRSTLEDSIESDLLLHVIDASDPRVDEKIHLVNSILDEIGATQYRQYVFNKIDQISSEACEELQERYMKYQPIFLSAWTIRGIDTLKSNISSFFYHT